MVTLTGVGQGGYTLALGRVLGWFPYRSMIVLLRPFFPIFSPLATPIENGARSELSVIRRSVATVIDIALPQR